MKNSSEPIEIKLTRPIEAHGDEVEALKIKEPTVKDIRNAGYPITATGEINANAAASLIASCADIPPSSVDAMSPKDFTNCIAAVMRFFGDAQPAI